MTFEQQILLTVLDKTLIGLLLLLFGLWCNRALERYKARQTLLGKIRERRFETMVPILARLDEWQSLVTSYFPSIRQIHIEYPEDKKKVEQLVLDQFARLEKKTELLRNEIQQLLEENRHWLGLELTNLITKHIERLDHCVTDSLTDKPYEFEWANAESIGYIPSLKWLIRKIEKIA